MANPWDNDPVIGSAPQAAAPAQGGIMYGTPKPEKPERPTPIPGYPGYFMGPDGKPFKPEGLPEKPTETPNANDQKLAGKRAALTSLEAQINRVDELYQKGFKDEALGVISSLGEYLPTNEAAQFNAAGAGLAEQGLAAFRVPGVGSQSDTELRQFVEANRPQNTDRDVAIEEKLRQLRTRVDATRAEMGLPSAQWLGSAPPAEAPQDTRAAIQQDGQVVYDNNAGEQIAPTTSGTQTVQNPQLAGVRGEYLARLQRGDGPGEIVQFLRSAGVTDPKLIATAVQQANFRRKNPNVPIDKYNTDALDLMDVPLSEDGVVGSFLSERDMNTAAQSPGGAVLGRMGNAYTGNSLDSIVEATGGNGERARIALDDMQRLHPAASFGGDLAGGIGAALTAEAALARAGVASGVARSVAADTTYGMAAGAGAADNGDRLSGAVKGGLSGLVGSVGGQAVARGVGSAISPTGGRLADLYDQGVRPTPGQRFVNSGVAGRALNNVEENLGSVPLVGSMIRGARQDARDQWQVAAFNSSLGEIGEKLPKGMKPGTAPHQFAQQKFNAVYDKARSGMKVAADEQLASEVGQLGEQIGNLAEPSIRRFETIIRNTVLRRVGSEIDGEAYKKIQSELGKTIRGIRKSPSGDGELADALDELKGIIDNAARRHSDPEAVALLDAADRGYAKFVQIEQASGRGGVGKDAGTFSPNDFASAVKGNGQRVRSKAYNQGQGLMQDFAAQGNNLVDRIPNSGSPERLMAAGTLAGGAQYMEPSTLGVLGIIGTLYAPGVRKGLAGAMAPRGPKAKAVADQVRKRARIAGAGGAAALTQTSGGQ
jgi:hypothetical protein